MHATQQSYSEQFDEQLGGDQHRFYPDIVLTSQPSVHFSQSNGGVGGKGQFSHGSGGVGGDKGVPFIKKIFDKIRSIAKLNKIQHNILFNIDTKL